MAYEKQTWQTGDVVTAEKLNHMEDGIASASTLMIHIDANDTMDKTWQQIYDAMTAGAICLIVATEEGNVHYGFINQVDRLGDQYRVLDVGGAHYTAATRDGYPTYGGVS